MTFLISAAGTGGHVFPGLAVGEALVGLGVEPGDVLFVGGDRIEATVYPGSGFPFLGLELRGLQRSLTTKNLGLPRMVWRARDRISDAIRSRATVAVLGMGGYVTIPTALATRKTGVPLFIAEQNAGAGLANRVASRWAVRSFTSFPRTRGLEGGEWVGNPVRKVLARFDRERLLAAGMVRYGLERGIPVLGVFGGSLGAGILNTAARDLVASWTGPDIQVVHLTGRGNVVPVERTAPGVRYHTVEFEDRMELFYAVSDLVVARAGGGVAELTATGTPSILVPGDFGSSGHQGANAEFLRAVGAARVLAQDRIGDLAALVHEVLLDTNRLEAMSIGARGIAKPEAAVTIAEAMLERAG
ncbi:MAG: UDP-N-acetylglucosamine--N-acetylmuramyl-(pentapeptide) pyrophosphoryl-undecaprenol N-acetylglucosamine transferase [Acidimicrobiia bacterium]